MKNLIRVSVVAIFTIALFVFVSCSVEKETNSMFPNKKTTSLAYSFWDYYYQSPEYILNQGIFYAKERTEQSFVFKTHIKSIIGNDNLVVQTQKKPTQTSIETMISQTNAGVYILQVYQNNIGMCMSGRIIVDDSGCLQSFLLTEQQKTPKPTLALTQYKYFPNRQYEDRHYIFKYVDGELEVKYVYHYYFTA